MGHNITLQNPLGIGINCVSNNWKISGGKYIEFGVQIGSIENLPDNLWAWLERTPKTAFNWCERKWKKRREAALRRAGLLVNGVQLKTPDKNGNLPKKKLPPHNAMRHSFASYHVAWKRDFQDTALIMSHKGTDILFKHYRGIATKENAEKYFDISPSGYMKNKIS